MSTATVSQDYSLIDQSHVTACTGMYMYMLEAFGLIFSGCPVLFYFSQLTSLCCMMCISTDGYYMCINVQMPANISALVQFGCYHWCSDTVIALVRSWFCVYKAAKLRVDYQNQDLTILFP